MAHEVQPTHVHAPLTMAWVVDLDPQSCNGHVPTILRRCVQCALASRCVECDGVVCVAVSLPGQVPCGRPVSGGGRWWVAVAGCGWRWQAVAGTAPAAARLWCIQHVEWLHAQACLLLVGPSLDMRSPRVSGHVIRYEEAVLEVMLSHGVDLDDAMQPPALPVPFLYRPFEAGTASQRARPATRNELTTTTTVRTRRHPLVLPLRPFTHGGLHADHCLRRSTTTRVS